MRRSVRNTTAFGSYMRTLRYSRSLKIREMGDLLEISRSNLGNIENGRQIVSPSKAAELSARYEGCIETAVEAALYDYLIGQRLYPTKVTVFT